MNRILAVLRQRCPVCLQGHVFKSILGMHSHCPTCGVKYERETGYFLNSMFIAYTLGFLLIIPLAVLLYLWDVSILVFTLIVTGFFVVVWPVIFRYSRIIWMHGDQVLDPREAPANSEAANEAGGAEQQARETLGT